LTFKKGNGKIKTGFKSIFILKMKKHLSPILIFSLLLNVVLIIFIFLLLPQSFGREYEGTATIRQVVRVIDGDTIVISGNKRVRLLGIDAPEKGERCFDEAKDKLTELVLNQKVLLKPDIRNKDQYDRLLRWVFLNGQNINLELVKQGLVRVKFYNEEQYKNEFIVSQKIAKEQRRGCLWKD